MISFHFLWGYNPLIFTFALTYMSLQIVGTMHMSEYIERDLQGLGNTILSRLSFLVNIPQIAQHLKNSVNIAVLGSYID